MLDWAQARAHYRDIFQGLAREHGDDAPAALGARAALRVLPLCPPARWLDSGASHATACALAAFASAACSAGHSLPLPLRRHLADAAMQAVISDLDDIDDAPSAARAALDAIDATEGAAMGALAVAYAATASLAAAHLDDRASKLMAACLDHDIAALDGGPEPYWCRPLWSLPAPGWFAPAQADWTGAMPMLAPAFGALVQGGEPAIATTLTAIATATAHLTA